MRQQKIIITGAAGLVGQNLITLLAPRTDLELVAIDKHEYNLNILQRTHSNVRTILANLADPGAWESAFDGADAVVQLHAQITGLSWEPFERNSVRATELVLERCVTAKVPYLIHASSSVVNSVANDHYVRSKTMQEQLVRASGVPHSVLRPTLMYGWFDPKHLGWLSRFMERVPIFPIPGHGRYMRQPLYVLDFCRVIERCLDQRPTGVVYDLVGSDRIDYIDIIRTIRRVKALRTKLVHLPLPIFSALLRLYGVAKANPPFTADQLKALTAPDDFSGVDLHATFGIQPTPFERGMRETLTDPRYSGLVLKSYV